MKTICPNCHTPINFGSVIGKLAKGVKKTISDSERERRRAQARINGLANRGKKYNKRKVNNERNEQN